MPCTDARPRPVPFPCSFVVKKGSNRCGRALGAMPTPLSLTRSRTYASAVLTSDGGTTSAARRRATSRRIRFYQRRLVRHLAGHFDVLADQPRQHALQPQDRLVEIEVLRHEHLFAAEREELLGK